MCGHFVLWRYLDTSISVGPAARREALEEGAGEVGEHGVRLELCRNLSVLKSTKTTLGRAPVFDPVAILLAAKSGRDPSAYTVLRPDPAYFARERFGKRLGDVGMIIYAVVWLLLIPTTGVAAFFFPNPLARAGLYLFGFSTALGGLAGAFVILPRSLERQSRRVLIFTPDGLILADWERSEVVRAIDYRATDKLTLEVVAQDVGPDTHRLTMSEHGRTWRWTIEEYFEAHPRDIASRVMRDYGRAKE